MATISSSSTFRPHAATVPQPPPSPVAPRLLPSKPRDLAFGTVFSPNTRFALDSEVQACPGVSRTGINEAHRQRSMAPPPKKRKGQPSGADPKETLVIRRLCEQLNLGRPVANAGPIVSFQRDHGVLTCLVQELDDSLADTYFDDATQQRYAAGLANIDTVSQERVVHHLEFDVGSCMREGPMQFANSFLLNASNYKPGRAPNIIATRGWYLGSSGSKGATEYLIVSEEENGIAVKAVLELKAFSTSRTSDLDSEDRDLDLCFDGKGRPRIEGLSVASIAALSQVLLEFHTTRSSHIFYGTPEAFIVFRLESKTVVKMSQVVPRTGVDVQLTDGTIRRCTPFSLLLAAMVVEPASESVLLTPQAMNSIVISKPSTSAPLARVQMGTSTAATTSQPASVTPAGKLTTASAKFASAALPSPNPRNPVIPTPSPPLPSPTLSTMDCGQPQHPMHPPPLLALSVPPSRNGPCAALTPLVTRTSEFSNLYPPSARVLHSSFTPSPISSTMSSPESKLGSNTSNDSKGSGPDVLLMTPPKPATQVFDTAPPILDEQNDLKVTQQSSSRDTPPLSVVLEAHVPESTPPTRSLSPPAPETLTVDIVDFLYTDGLYDVYAATAMLSNSDQKVNVIVKACNPNIVEGLGHRVLHEARIYTDYLVALQGSTVSRFYGLWLARYTAVRDVFEVYIMVLEDAGRTVDELPDVPTSRWDSAAKYHVLIDRAYSSLHAAGVVHNSYDLGNLATRLANTDDDDMPVEHEPDELVILDFTQADGRDDEDFGPSLQFEKGWLSRSLDLCRATT